MNRLFEYLLGLLYPSKCIFCRKLLTQEENGICSHCSASLPQFEGPGKNSKFFDRCTSCYEYRDEVRSSLLRYKFQDASHYASVYGKLLAVRLWEDGLGNIDFVTWVPVSRRRKRKRGYDQAELLAAAVAKELQLPLQRTLDKFVHNQPQSQKTHAERQANVRGVYQLVDDCCVKDKHILLIDDIITTGATLSECSCVLKIAGAQSIHCGTLAATVEKTAKQVKS